ncbi:MAG: hypothetical protein K0S04_3834 [Herbinix sp.]|jgi:hypothetical protein|nr:hypothetical protein [Herbinix sp.]
MGDFYMQPVKNKDDKFLFDLTIHKQFQLPLQAN